MNNTEKKFLAGTNTKGEIYNIFGEKNVA